MSWWVYTQSKAHVPKFWQPREVGPAPRDLSRMSLVEGGLGAKAPWSLRVSSGRGVHWILRVTSSPGKLLLLFDKGCSFSAACGDRRGADCALRLQIHTEVSTPGSVPACRQKAVEEGAILVAGRNMRDPVFGAALFLQQRQDAPDLTWSGCGGKRLCRPQWAWGEVCGIVTRGQIERGSWSLCLFWQSP